MGAVPRGVCVLKEAPDVRLPLERERPGELRVVLYRLDLLRGHVGEVLPRDGSVGIRGAWAPRDVPSEARRVVHELPSAPAAGPDLGVRPLGPSGLCVDKQVPDGGVLPWHGAFWAVMALLLLSVVWERGLAALLESSRTQGGGGEA